MKNLKLLYAGFGFLIAYIGLNLLVVNGAFLANDTWLAIKINSLSSSALTPLMVDATNYGREYFWIAIVAIMIIFGKREMKLLALELAFLFIAGIAVGEALKIIYYRERPFQVLGTQINLLVPTDTDSSFPSGHAVIVGIGAFFAYSRIKGKIASALLIIEAAVVCYSRVYVGAHYPTDVLGGLLIAGAITYIGLYLAEGPLNPIFQRSGGILGSILKNARIPDVLLSDAHQLWPHKSQDVRK